MRDRVALKRAFVASVLVLASAGGCGSSDSVHPFADPFVATTSSAIQGGMADTTHTFAVGVATMSQQGVGLCSGVLLAPNLVATARHCVSLLASGQIDCATSMFSGTLPAKDVFVTSNPTINATTAFVTVVAGSSGHDGIIVPPGSAVCGNDIALLILSEPIQIPQYVTPTINPPMSDQRAYSTAITAIGYGIDSPADTNGTSAGVRRIKGDINLSCIPNDATFNDCLQDPQWLQVATANEFSGGDGTCEGDSGSGAYDQGSFNKGNWVAFGVLSRGGLSPEGGTCIGSIYSRFDAWSQLIIDTAAKAASMGGYSPPGWTGTSPQPSPSQTQQQTPSQAPPPSTCVANGTACGQDSDCCSVNCISHDQNTTAFCTACDGNNPCVSGYGCTRGVCVLGAAGSPASAIVDAGIPVSVGLKAHGAGCSIAPERTQLWPAVASGVACALVAGGRRRRKPIPVGIRTLSR